MLIVSWMLSKELQYLININTKEYLKYELLYRE